MLIILLTSSTRQAAVSLFNRWDVKRSGKVGFKFFLISKNNKKHKKINNWMVSFWGDWGSICGGDDATGRSDSKSWTSTQRAHFEVEQRQKPHPTGFCLIHWKQARTKSLLVSLWSFPAVWIKGSLPETIANHCSPKLRKPPKNHYCWWLIPPGTIAGDGDKFSKTIAIPSLEKNNHRHSIALQNWPSFRSSLQTMQIITGLILLEIMTKLWRFQQFHLEK